MNTKDAFEPGGLGIDESPILPDGWKPGDDIFADTEEREDETLSDVTEESDDPFAENGDAETTETDDPTTVGGDGSDGSSADAEEGGTEPDASSESHAAAPRILKPTYNHKTEEFDVNAASDEALIEMYQKAKAFDAVKDEQLKAKYREVYQDLCDAGIPESLAKLGAANECGGKNFPLSDDDPGNSGEGETEGKPKERNFAEQLQQLKALFPDVKEMPQPVMDAYAKGAELVSAYSAYVVSKQKKSEEAVTKENKILKQNAAAAAKAPVKGVSGGGTSAKSQNTDRFLKGFESDPW